MTPRLVLAAWCLVTLVGAALDTLWIRLTHEHRPPEPRLAFEALLLWGALAALALVPAALVARFPRGRRAGAVRFTLTLLVCALAPVVAHATLDRHTSLGGDLSALKAPGPWLEAGAACALLVGLAFALAKVAHVVGAGRAAGLAVVLALAGLAWSSFAGAPEAGARAAAPPRALGASGASSERPNLLLLVWDTARATSLNVYGYDRDTTPELAALADRSLVFSNARSASVFTLTSHLSMLTGVYPSHHGASLTRQYFDPRETPTVARQLQQAGYRTGAFVGTDVLRADTGVVDGFEHFDDLVDPPVTYGLGWALVHDVQSIVAKRVPGLYNDGRPHWIQDFQRPADDVLPRALEWIRADDPRPWFCFVNLYDVHWPYVPAPEFEDAWVEPYDGPVDGFLFRSDDWVPGTELGDPDHRHLTQLYDGELAELDRKVDAFLSELELDDVGLILTSDHGEAFGEAGRYEHFDILEPQVRVPLIVKPPGSTEARWSDAPVSGIDVAPTLLAMAGIQGSERTGRNLLDVAHAAGRERPLLVENRDKMTVDEFRVALYQGPWKLVRNGAGDDATWELFDLRDDPLGERDVSAEEPEQVRLLRDRFEALRATWGATDELGAGVANSGAMAGLGYLDQGEDTGAEAPREGRE